VPALLPDDNGHDPPQFDRPAKGTLRDSFRHAFSGLAYVVRVERNPRIHLAFAVFALVLGLWLGLSPIEWALIVVAIAGVFAGEMLNTVAELVVDLITLDHHPLAKQAKDVAAGAVLVASIAAAIIGLVVMGPHLWARLASLVN
jgi:diacylglycerol kinase